MDDEDVKKKIERQALNTLLSRGLYFEIPGRLFFKRHTWRIIIRQQLLGSLDYLTDLYLQIDINEDKIKADPEKEARRLAGQYARLMARVVAIAFLNSKWKIRLFSRYMTNWFLWKLTPQRLFDLTLAIKTLSNTADFVGSIRSIALVRTTAPREPEDRIEKK